MHKRLKDARFLSPSFLLKLVCSLNHVCFGLFSSRKLRWGSNFCLHTIWAQAKQSDFDLKEVKHKGNQIKDTIVTLERIGGRSSRNQGTHFPTYESLGGFVESARQDKYLIDLHLIKTSLHCLFLRFCLFFCTCYFFWCSSIFSFLFEISIEILLILLNS